MAAIERAAKAGVIVVVAAGNQGPAAGTIGDYASAPDAITMAAIHNDRSLGYAITIDGVAPYAAYAGDGPNPGQAIGGTLFDVTAVDATRACLLRRCRRARWRARSCWCCAARAPSRAN